MIKIVRLDKKDINSLVELVLLADPSSAQSADLSEWSYRFRQGIKAWGIKSKGKLIATESLSYYNIPGEMMNIPDFRVAVLDNGFVHPDYRGRGYHKVLILVRTIHALWEGDYKIHSMTKTGNIASIKNLEKMQFNNVDTQEIDYCKTYLFEFNSRFLINLFKIINKFRVFLLDIAFAGQGS